MLIFPEDVGGFGVAGLDSDSFSSDEELRGSIVAAVEERARVVLQYLEGVLSLFLLCEFDVEFDDLFFSLGVAEEEFFVVLIDGLLDVCDVSIILASLLLLFANL